MSQTENVIATFCIFDSKLLCNFLDDVDGL